jgi:NTP pyrophosphatase (non-canonical NTP hydrolase)
MAADGWRKPNDAQSAIDAKQNLSLWITKNNPPMSDIKTLTRTLVDFRNERNWEQFHNPKDLALALSIEAAELCELYLWKNKEEINEINQEKIREELADVFAYAFMLAEKYGFDVSEIVLEKIKKNAKKYPVEKSKNLATKYTDL